MRVETFGAVHLPLKAVHPPLKAVHLPLKAAHLPLKAVPFVIVIAAILLLTMTACFEEPLEPGQREVAPPFDLPLLDGGHVDLSAQRGKIVVLDFWATWCAPCEVQMPVLDTLWAEAGGDELMVLGISVDTDPASKVEEWVKERGFSYPIAIADQELAMDFGVFGFPSLIVLDPDGRIFTRHVGVWSRPEIEEVLEQVRRAPSAPDSTPGSGSGAGSETASL